MNFFDRYYFLLVVLSITSVVAIFAISDKRGGKYYDCRISEISPDYPPQIKEACRQLRAQQNKK